MNREQWLFEATASLLTERQAEALYRRQAGEGRQAAAEAMGISASNLDNAEREAREKINRAHNLVALAEAIGAAPDENAPIGTCAECDEPSSELALHPDDSQQPMEGARQICLECHPDREPAG